MQLHLDSITAENKKGFDLLSAKMAAESHIAQVLETAGTLPENLHVQLDSTLNAKRGILQPQFVFPSLLMNALSQSTFACQKDTVAPFSLSKDSSHLVFKASDVHVFINGGTLRYVTALPLG